MRNLVPFAVGTLVIGSLAVSATVAQTAASPKSTGAPSGTVKSSARNRKTTAKPAANPPAETPVPNAEIVKMIQGGIPETVVLARIHADFNTLDKSGDAMLALKQAGATEAEMKAFFETPATPSVATVTAAQPPPAAPVAAFGGTLLHTAQGVPFIQFPATSQLVGPDGRPNNTAYLMRYKGKPAIVIPTALGRLYDDKINLYGINVMHRWSWQGGTSGSMLFTADKQYFEKYGVHPAVIYNEKDKAEKKAFKKDPGPFIDKAYERHDTVQEVDGKLEYAEKQDQKWLGLKKAPKIDKKGEVKVDERIKGDGYWTTDIPVYLVGMTGALDQLANNKVLPASYRSVQLQLFVQSMLDHFPETLAEFEGKAGLPADASLWPSSLEYVPVNRKFVDQYIAIEKDMSKRYKDKHPQQSGLLNMMNTMQNIQNVRQEAATADLNHDTMGQLTAAVHAGQVATGNNPTFNPNAANMGISPATPGAATSGSPVSAADTAAAGSGGGGGSYNGEMSGMVKKFIAIAPGYSCKPFKIPPAPSTFNCVARDGSVYKARAIAVAIECSSQTGETANIPTYVKALKQEIEVAADSCRGASYAQCSTANIMPCSQLTQ